MTRLSGGDWLSAGEAAGLLGLTQRRVNRLIADGRLPAVRVGKANIVLRRDVEAFAKLDRPAGRPPKSAKPHRGGGQE